MVFCWCLICCIRGAVNLSVYGMKISERVTFTYID